MSSLEEENENAICMIYYSFYLLVKKMQVYYENDKSFLLIHFKLELWNTFISIISNTWFAMNIKTSRYCD